MLYVVAWSWTLFVCLHAKDECDVTGVDGSTYRQEVLRSKVAIAYFPAINWRINTLYYSYTEENYTRAVYVAMNLNNNTSTVIEGLSAKCHFAEDRLDGKVFAGCWWYIGKKGLFQLNSNLNRFVLVGEKGENIQFVHYADDVLYYSTAPTYGLRAYAHGVSRPVMELGDAEVTGLVVGGAGEWVFYNSRGLWRRGQKTGEVRIVVESRNDQKMAVSPFGDVIICYPIKSPNGTLYNVLPDATLSRLLSAPYCFYVVVDANGKIIYMDVTNKKIFRLTKC